MQVSPIHGNQGYHIRRAVTVSGVSSMELRELEHRWHNSKIGISVTTIDTHNRKLVASTNNRLTGL